MWANSSSWRSGTLALALAGGVEFGLQMAVGVVLARYLDETAFAQYRLLWLLVGTVLAISPMFIPQSLFYFLNRVQATEKRVYVGNALMFLAAAGLVTGVVVSGTNPWQPEAAKTLFDDTAGLSALFLGLWVVASLLDALPTADGRLHLQAGATVTLAVLRTGLLVGAAMLSGTMLWIALAMLLLVVTKLLMLWLYMRRHGPRGGSTWDPTVLRQQITYAIPFAVANGLFLLRVQSDQWVVVSMLPTAMYATFSVAAVVLSVPSLIRLPVINALMPRLNRSFGNHDLVETARLISLSNGAMAMLLIPVAGGLFVCAPEVVELLYTSRYRDAAPVMQVYLIGMMVNAVAVGHTLPALGHGKFAAINSGVCLLLSIGLCTVGVTYFGMVGAAAATMLTLAIGELWALAVISRTLATTPQQLIYWRALLPALAGMAVALLAVAWMTGGWSMPLLQGLALKSMIYAAVFSLVFLLCRGVPVFSELAGLRMRQAAEIKG